ncbi:MAG: hypothetical protein BGN85_11595 [Alphaproteobacteria bacterium 64-11]|nr:MAG: hypothetical protein BGN85_11595 [Alphaproteobacteria bacterium 64-11]
MGGMMPARAQSPASVGTFQIEADASSQPRTISFGQVFLPGQVQRGDRLEAVLDGHPVPTQIDAKAFNSDGSVRHAIVTLELPKLRSGQTLAGAFIKGARVVSAPFVAGSVPALTVSITPKGVAKIDIELQKIARDPRNASPRLWIDGSLAQERRYSADVNDHLQILFDVFTPRNGPQRVDVIFHNDWTGIRRNDNLEYDVAMALAGAPVFEAKDVQHYTFADWHHLLWTDGGPSIRVKPDLATLAAAGAVPHYAQDFSISSDIYGTISRLAGKMSDRPMQQGTIDNHMPDTGGRMDIGPMPTWAVVDLMDGSEDSRKLLLANADAAGSVPWHLRDRKSGLPLTIDAYPQLWLDSRGKAQPGVLPEPFQQEHHGWTLDDAHQPALSYLPYLLTGSQYYRDELAAQAAYVLLSFDPYYRGGSHGILIGEHVEAWIQVRGLAWSLRTLANAAYILPDDYPLHAYFDAKLRANLAKLADAMIEQRKMKDSGALEGWMPGDYRPDGATAPWQSAFLIVTLNWINDMGYPQAGRVAGWMANFIAGLFTSGDQGFDPSRGTTYILMVYDPASKKRFDTWAEAFEKSALNKMPDKEVAENWTELGMIMRAGTGAAYAASHSPRALKAYQYVSQRFRQVTYRPATGDPTFAILPPDTGAASGKSPPG